MKTVNSNILSKIQNSAKCCNKGRVSKNTQVCEEIENYDTLFNELHDLNCVSYGNKPLAALDYSNYGKNKLKRFNLKMKNAAIQVANSKKVEMLHNTVKGGLYLKTIFFLPKNYNNALKLMYILWYNTKFLSTQTEEHIAIGILLGYSKKNILYFLSQSNSKKYSSIYEKVRKTLKIFDVKLENLQKKYKILHLKTIPYLTVSNENKKVSSSIKK